MDLLLTLAEQFVFTWVWTEELLDEWERVIIETKHRTPESAKSITAAVRAHFGSGLIKADTYVDDISDDLSSDPGDRATSRHVLGVGRRSFSPATCGTSRRRHWPKAACGC